MDPAKLHRAARRYLMRRYEELTSSYDELPNQGRAADGYHYSLEARRIFPRYRVVEAMLEQVERLDPDRLPEYPHLTAALFQAAEEAQSAFTEPLGEVEAAVIGAERAAFASMIQRWIAAPDVDAGPPAYRRVLTAEESLSWRQRLRLRWGLENMCWYPMLASPPPEEVLIVQELSMWEEDVVARVREVLRDAGVGRVAELREYGADYLLDPEIFAPRYSGAEGVWSDDGIGWIAYASSEGTVAFGGVLATALPAKWLDLDRWRWTGGPTSSGYPPG